MQEMKKSLDFPITFFCAQLFTKHLKRKSAKKTNLTEKGVRGEVKKYMNNHERIIVNLQ